MRQIVFDFCRRRWTLLGFFAQLALFLCHRKRWRNIPTLLQIKCYNKELQNWEGYEIDGTCVRVLSTRPDPRSFVSVFVSEAYLTDEMIRTLNTYLAGSVEPWPTFAGRFALFLKRLARPFGLKLKDVFQKQRNAERSVEAGLIAIGNIDEFKSLLKRNDPLTMDLVDLMEIFIQGGR